MAFLLAIPPDTRFRGDDDFVSSTKASGVRAPRTPLDSASTQAEIQGQDGMPELTPASTMPRRQLVLPDPVAFRYLETDPCVTIVERQHVLRGYELYLVEQWACSRQSPTLVIVTYTGDEKHAVVVGVLSVPADETHWSTKLRVYFKAIHQYHARPKDTELGELMITNLSSFPSALTVIPVPDGDIRKHRQVFVVNENLKRLGCLGRSGLTLTEPNKAAQAKFQQVYKTSERVPFFQAVIELVKLCQVALHLFEKLDHEYIDGLLCDVTETAIGNWWTEVGAEHYNFEPTDGILGPSTVAALLGMLMGARNRLQWYGAPVSKDVFDIENTKRGIAYLQKSQKIDKTRRLDRQTIVQLHAETAKAAAGEGWRMQKAVKSTMSEIGGKRGEIVMGMVSGGKEKVGIAEIETIDYDRFVALVYGERPKWLWHGKPRRAAADAPSNSESMGDVGFGKDDPPSQPVTRYQTFSGDTELEQKRKEELPGPYLTHSAGSASNVMESPGEKDVSRRNVLKSVAGKMNDARSGFGRIKDAVGGGLRGHNSRLSTTIKEDLGDLSGGTNTPRDSATYIPPGRAFTWNKKPEEYLASMKRGDAEAVPSIHGDDEGARKSIDIKIQDKLMGCPEETPDTEVPLDILAYEVRKNVLSKVPSGARSMVDEMDLRGAYLDFEEKADPGQLALVRRRSFDFAELARPRLFNEHRWPRRMSFGDAEEAILGWDEIFDVSEVSNDMAVAGAFKTVARHLYERIDDIESDLEPWVAEKLKMIEVLDEHYGQQNENLKALYEQLSAACHRVSRNSEELLSSERAQLTESVKEIEVLVARLEYEINALSQRVHDVEDGIQGFERQVEDVEKRADELKKQLETESWLHWLVRTLTGVGTGPNITRSTT
ncbi:hypothetical protein B0I35DRAFT_392019 [Stachybotrys elegans]|uniref:STB6-like N-terminal domain-containing protein n=1 Tax=Stachybotrys elegans TaxID=80388 RepID=A0A8K0WRB9_9HYPO|nr:hypothetical protein B0I35DRAFT_392019 [Stachybotrys elegans]